MNKFELSDVREFVLGGRVKLCAVDNDIRARGYVIKVHGVPCIVVGVDAAILADGPRVVCEPLSFNGSLRLHTALLRRGGPVGWQKPSPAP